MLLLLLKDVGFHANSASEQCFTFSQVLTYYHQYITFCKVQL